MTESEFLALAEQTLVAIENAVEQIADSHDLDIECSRSGNVLELEWVPTRSKMIVNTQAPMKEIWVAARSGGFHYRYDDGKWLNTRDGSELFAALSVLLSEHAGTKILLPSG